MMGMFTHDFLSRRGFFVSQLDRNLGVDDVRFVSAAVPEAGASGAMLLIGLLSIAAAARVVRTASARPR